MKVEKDFKEFIELLNKNKVRYLIVGGTNFKDAWKNKTIGTYGDAKAFFISKADLLKNKKATGRKQDLADVEKLEKI